MNDIRWFAPNSYAALLATALRRRGLSIALDGAERARLALSMSGTTAVSAWQYARRWGCPLVLYIWDLPPKATGSGSYDPVLPLGGHLIRLPRLSGGFGQRRGYYSRLRYIAAQAHEIWVPSRMTAELVRSRFGTACRRVPYCYDSERFRPANGPKEFPPTLLTVGRLKAHKNHAATLHVASQIGRKVQVRLIGRGPELEPLQQLARALRVDCRIDTRVDDRGVADAYRRAQVVVCPSRFEGFGLTPVEAIASGTPVVASDIPPHREFVGAAAHLVQLDDDPALVHAVSGALDDGPPDPAAVSDLMIPVAAERFMSLLRPLLQ
ncbi:MAG TPA: glycosyltransferase [Gemmatimonadales bacterium]